MIRIPIVIGKNRLRGNSTGAMVDEEPGESHLARLHEVLSGEALDAGITPTREWLSNSVSSLLKLYEGALAKWQANKDGTIGFIYELAMPSGKVVLLGDRRLLCRI